MFVPSVYNQYYSFYFSFSNTVHASLFFKRGIFYFSFYRNATMCSNTTTCKLNLLIREIIDEVISNFDAESSKVTIESFQRKKDSLVHYRNKALV